MITVCALEEEQSQQETFRCCWRVALICVHWRGAVWAALCVNPPFQQAAACSHSIEEVSCWLYSSSNAQTDISFSCAVLCCCVRDTGVPSRSYFVGTFFCPEMQDTILNNVFFFWTGMAMLCHVLCCAVLCCVVLCCAALCCYVCDSGVPSRSDFLGTFFCPEMHDNILKKVPVISITSLFY